MDNGLRACAIGILGLALAFGVAACGDSQSGPAGRVINAPLRAQIGQLDPVTSSTQYSNMCAAAIFDTLLQYSYVYRPYRLEPSLVKALPTYHEGTKTLEDGSEVAEIWYEFELKPGIIFHDDPAFGEEGPPELTVDDVFYSIKRMADARWIPQGWWVYEGRIVGLDEFKAAQEALQTEAEAKGEDFRFDYDAPVSGLEKIDKYRFRIHLTKPFPQFLNVLCMTYASIVNRKVVELYDKGIGQHPVGTGAFRVKSFESLKLVLEKNPNFREEYYPELPAEDYPGKERDIAMGLYQDAGKRLPLADGIVFKVFEEDNPMWLLFQDGQLDYSQVPAEPWDTVFKPDLTLRDDFKSKYNVTNFNLPLLDMIYYGFNYEDPVWGGDGKGKLLRQAVAAALDNRERNELFYNGKNTLYSGPIPPNTAEFEADLPDLAYDANVEEAKRLLAQAGHPNGEGLPPLLYETSTGGNSKEQSEFLLRCLTAVGLKLEVNFNSFPELNRKLKNKQAQFFGLAWGADYPDAENFLQLFYGPNESPGSNNFNYKNPEYDRLYEQASKMSESPERTKLYRQMRDIVRDSAISLGSMSRIRFYVMHERLKNFKPEEVFYSYWKYLDLKTPAAASAP